MAKAIILSGGGSKGAWGVGVAQALLASGKTYDIAIGTSTGALMAPFILTGEIDALIDGYTSVDQESIFNKNPFKPQGGIKPVAATFKIIGGKKTLGESKNLKKKIDSMISDAMLDKIRTDGKLMGATVANLNKGISQVKTTSDYGNDQMRNWIWASANNPIFMSKYEFEENGEKHSYADGGITNYANVDYIVEHYANEIDEIDVIFHNTREVIVPKEAQKLGFLDRLLRIMDMMSAEINKNDLVRAQLNFKPKNDVKLNIYYMREEDIVYITGKKRNSLLFNKSKMQLGVMRGRETFNNGTIEHDGCLLSCNDGTIHLT